MPKKEFCKRNHLMSETRCYDKSGQPFCRLCKNITAIERRKKNLAIFRKRDSIFNIKKHYGLNETEYNNLILQANNQCMICKSPPTRTKLSVDHCHTTKKIRGLLCHNCNMALGLFKDNTDLLEKAIKYLKG
jgi:hypothetical protein